MLQKLATGYLFQLIARLLTDLSKRAGQALKQFYQTNAHYFILYAFVKNLFLTTGIK